MQASVHSLNFRVRNEELNTKLAYAFEAFVRFVTKNSRYACAVVGCGAAAFGPGYQRSRSGPDKIRGYDEPWVG